MFTRSENHMEQAAAGTLTLRLRIPSVERRQSRRRSSPAGAKGQAVRIWLPLNTAYHQFSLTPPLFQARAREFCPSLREASVRIFPFTAMSSSPGTMPPANKHFGAAHCQTHSFMDTHGRGISPHVLCNDLYPSPVTMAAIKKTQSEYK